MSVLSWIVSFIVPFCSMLNPICSLLLASLFLKQSYWVFGGLLLCLFIAYRIFVSIISYEMVSKRSFMFNLLFDYDLHRSVLVQQSLNVSDHQNKLMNAQSIIINNIQCTLLLICALSDNNIFNQHWLPYMCFILSIVIIFRSTISGITMDAVIWTFMDRCVSINWLLLITLMDTFGQISLLSLIIVNLGYIVFIINICLRCIAMLLISYNNNSDCYDIKRNKTSYFLQFIGSIYSPFHIVPYNYWDPFIIKCWFVFYSFLNLIQMVIILVLTIKQDVIVLYIVVIIVVWLCLFCIQCYGVMILGEHYHDQWLECTQPKYYNLHEICSNEVERFYWKTPTNIDLIIKHQQTEKELSNAKSIDR
eukprot:275189_1